MKKKRIIFIRHGESFGNALLKLTIETFASQIHFLSPNKLASLPSALISAISLSSLTKLGCIQAGELRRFIETSSQLTNASNYVIVHSTLLRARQTASILFPKHPMTTLSMLREVTISEEVSGVLPPRLREFENWLSNTPHETIIIVGHCQYFRKLFGLAGHICNCDMWTCDASVGTSAISYNNLQLLYRCELAYPHPLDSLLGTAALSSQKEERTCRICHGSSADTTEQLIKPCLCRGSQLYVHISCLNQWRSTSASANYRCSVCHYSYRTERTTISRLITSDMTRYIITGLGLLSVFGFLGMVIRSLGYFLGYDVCAYLCSFGRIDMFWRWRNTSYFGATINFYDTLITWLFCNRTAGLVIEVNLLGAEAAGAVFIAHHMILLLNNFRVDQRRVLQIIAVNALFFATTNAMVLCRLFMLFGAAVACKSLFAGVHRYSIYWSSKLGEKILEVS